MSPEALRIVAIGASPVLQAPFEAAGFAWLPIPELGGSLEATTRADPDAILIFSSSRTTVAGLLDTLRAEPCLATVPVAWVSPSGPGGEALPGAVLLRAGGEVSLLIKQTRALARRRPAPSAVDPSTEVEAVPGAPERVLLVDDDPWLLKLTSLAMRQAGFHVETADDGAAGHRRARELKPDVLVIDLVMPQFDGWGLLSAVRADYRIAETPIIVLSSHEELREGLRARAAGAQAYLAKVGSTPHVLASHVRQVLAPRRAAQAGLVHGRPVSAPIETLGLRWSLRMIEANCSRGSVALTAPGLDGLFVTERGRLRGAFAKAGGELITGEAALAIAVTARSGTLMLSNGAPPTATNLDDSVDPLLDRAASRANALESEAIERAMVSASNAEADPELLALYARFAPPRFRDVALAAGGGLTPFELLRRTQLSPVEVEGAVRDLLRRRVISLA